MGAGNVCVSGTCEGLFYVDNKFLDVYSKLDTDGKVIIASSDEYLDDGYDYDEHESLFQREEFEHLFCELVMQRFKSFDYINKWITRSRRAILENELFYIVCEDNGWSLAIELIQKEGEYGGDEKVGLQMGLYLTYLDGIKKILLDMNGEVGVYKGAWTSGVITK